MATSNCNYLTMEVHHHPEGGKKRFKEYLSEGLMIFLAVTMGFIAESLRENINTKDKEKNYIVSFENNLEKDKADLDSTIVDNQKKIKGLDSLLSLSDKDIMGSEIDIQICMECQQFFSFYQQRRYNDTAKKFRRFAIY